ncbi:hypothetical protein DV736_g6415, partial [Chaetothyriales sp. CBS 134916]
MRFKSQIKNVSVFAKFCASLASLHQIAWCRLNDDDVRFTVLPERGSQAWCVLKLDTVFDTYIIQSAAPKNTINLEVPIQALQRALRSALRATSVQLRLTKKDNVPMLSLTIVTNTTNSGNSVVSSNPDALGADELGGFDFDNDLRAPSFGSDVAGRETIITQDVPVKVLPMQSVSHLHEPSCPSSDVNIFLPHLAQVKALSERFTKLALSTQKGPAAAASSPRLELSANMHGSFQIAVKTDALSIASRWTGLSHPELDASMFPNGSQGVRDDPSSRKKELGGPDGQDPAGWTAVRIDAKDWSRVLSVGRLNSRVIATFIPDHGLVLYVYLPAEDEGSEESVLTYYISSFST